MSNSRYSDSINESSFMGYQLLGDSQLLRFAEKVLKKCRKKFNGDGYLGFCVSGQKIEDLLKRVRDNARFISCKLVLMIGTNNILQFSSFEDMRNNFENLVLLLIEKGVTKLVILTIPPIPRLRNSTYHWNTLRKFNEHIKSLHNGEDIFVIDAYVKFIEETNESSSNLLLDSRDPHHTFHDSYSIPLPYPINDEDNGFPRHYNTCADSLSDSQSVIIGDEIKMDLFEKYLNDSNTKQDLVHLNLQGLNIIKQLILGLDNIC